MSDINTNNLNLIDLTDKEFLKIADIVYETFGIHLPDKKKTLVKGRLQKTIKRLKLNSFSEYLDYIKNDKSNNSLLELVDHISTNHTYFFRENEHFNFLQSNILPEFVQKAQITKNNKLRIWSAGCSSGEEPYTLAIAIHEFFKENLKNWDIKILATDISVTVLEKSQKGIYPKTSITSLSPLLKNKYFSHISKEYVELNQSIKNMILFKRLNLNNDKFPFENKFDLILCRNVMIYFDDTTRTKVVNNFYKYLNNGGYFFIGHSESLNRVPSPFKFVKPAIYRKNHE